MEALEKDLCAIVGEGHASVQRADRSAYAHDLWPRQLIATRGDLPRPRGPRAVVWPANPEELSSLLRWCASRGVRVTPFGAGSAVTGGLSLDDDVIAVDMKRLRALRSVDVARGVADIDVGWLGQHLEEELQRRGATLGHFPSSIYCSTLGGWVATRGAGQCSGRYGKIEDMVVGVEGVLPTGEPFRADAPRAGEIDARALMVGSEGLFGFITSAKMRIWPAPSARRFAAYTFRTMEQAWTAIREMYQSGLRPAVTRLYDPFDSFLFRSGGRSSSKSHHAPGEPSRWMEPLLRRVLANPERINRLNSRFGRAAFGRSLLIVVFEGTPREPLDDELAAAESIASRLGGRDEGEALGRRWLARRHSVSYRMAPTFMRGIWVDTMEVAAPWSRLRALYDATRAALGEGGFVMAHLSHAYPDGCSIYFTFAGGGSDDAAALALYERTWARALVAAHQAGGTIAHHHGVGRSKRQAMRLELGAGVDVIDELSAAADPANVMLRGALVPRADAANATFYALPESGLDIDAASRLADVPAGARLHAVREALDAHGLALPDAPADGTVREWLAATNAAAPCIDPVDHRVAGFRARTHAGSLVRLSPVPRRAVGPDLTTLFASGDVSWGTLERVCLRVRGRLEPAPAFVGPVSLDEPGAEASPGVVAWLDRARDRLARGARRG